MEALTLLQRGLSTTGRRTRMGALAYSKGNYNILFNARSHLVSDPSVLCHRDIVYTIWCGKNCHHSQSQGESESRVRLCHHSEWTATGSLIGSRHRRARRCASQLFYYEVVMGKGNPLGVTLKSVGGNTQFRYRPTPAQLFWIKKRRKLSSCWCIRRVFRVKSQ